jgi:FAD/FMN-containing dehydrogenase
VADNDGVRTEPDRAGRSRGKGGRLLARRKVLAGAMGAAAAPVLGWAPAYRVEAASAARTLPTPPNLPSGISVYQQAYQNWSREITLDAVWTCAPQSPTDVVTMANWARANAYRVRPCGARHGWTPLTVVNGESVDRVILLDTTQRLNTISVNAGRSPATFTAGAGARMEDILQTLQDVGLGLVSVPAPGVLTIAGALAVNGHGAAVPANGEKQIPGTTYGSLSNLVTSLDAVVFDEATDSYVRKTFDRSDPAITPMLTHLGRCFLVAVTMQAGTNYRLRCQSTTDIPYTELFAPAGTNRRTFASYLDAAGRAEAIWFPFTDTPWLKTWTPAPEKPYLSRRVTRPYNYPFSDSISKTTSDFIARMLLGDVSGTPAFGAFQLAVVKAGLLATGSWDVWGWSKDLLLYVRPTTQPMTAGGGVVLTSRANVQTVIHQFTRWYADRLATYRSRGEFPANGPVEIRCCGLDQPTDVTVPSAGPPTLSAIRPRPDRPEWDTAVWMNPLSLPGTPGLFAFHREVERWMTATYTGSHATFRPEWAKGWAFTTDAAYADDSVITESLPEMYRAGVPTTDNWDSAREVLNTLDPARIFTNSLIDRLLP